MNWISFALGAGAMLVLVNIVFVGLIYIVRRQNTGAWTTQIDALIDYWEEANRIGRERNNLLGELQHLG